jgi:hypothetical protein
LLENEKVHMPKGRSADAIPTKLDENNSDKVIESPIILHASEGN